MNIDFNKIKKIHFIGIGGIGLCAIARLMKEKGKEVSGSDLSPSLMTDKLEKAGIKIYIGQSEENISQDMDLIIYTTAVPENNPELKKARKIEIKTITYPESLGLIFNKKLGIAVCGTHGKSSVSAIAGLLLDDAKLDPSIVVGSIVPRYDNNLRIGEGKYFLTEACEYERSFLSLYPKIIILNNIELDHTDYYKDIEDMKSTFEEFIEHLPRDGTLIMNGDDKTASSIKHHTYRQAGQASSVIRFGLNENNNVRGYDVKFENGRTKFKVFYANKNLGEFVLKVPGLFNVYNALSVITLGLALKIPVDVIKKSLANYSGIWRRFEIKGKYKNALVISDYAHHPTAVKATIEAAGQFYPGKRIFAVFQPHQRNRTKKLYKDFLNSFDDVDVLILSEIFDVAGREDDADQNISSLDLAEGIKERTDEKKLKSRETGKLDRGSIFYAENLKKARKLIDGKVKPDDILLIMGAGDIYKIADELIKK